MTPRRAELRLHLALAAAVLAFGWPVLAGQTLAYGDITLQFIPWRTFARQQLLSGVVPLWAPGLYLGTPLLANGQSAVLYPFHLLAVALAPARVIALGYLLHLGLGVGGTAVFLRGRGHSRPAAALGALAFGLGGFVVSRQQFPSLAYTIAWLPWLLWASDRLWRVPGPRTAAVLAAVTAAQWLAGHAQMSVLQLALVVVWRLSTPGATDGPPQPPLAEGGRRAARWGWWLAGLVLGTLAASAQLWPTFELLRLSPRTGFTFDDVARFNLPPWQVPMLLLPRLFGSPEGRLPYLGVGAYWETLNYAGLAPLALAFAGARRRPFWAGIAVLGLLLAFGRYTPLYRTLYESVGLFRLFRDPARFALWTSFALAPLAAAGCDEAPAAARRAAWALAGVLAAVMLAAALAPSQAAGRLVTAVLAASPTKSVGQPGQLGAAWTAAVAAEALLGAALAALAAGLLPSAAARRWLAALTAADLLLHLGAANPMVPARLFAADPVPAAVPRGSLIYVPSERLAEVTPRHFNLAAVPRPLDVAGARASLVPDVTLGTAVRQVSGYDPLRTAAVLRWLESLESAPLPERDRRLAALGVAGRFDAGGWHPYPRPAGEARAEATGAALPVRRPTPQRCLIAGLPAGPVALTQGPAPGWQALGGRPLPASEAVVARWQPDPGARALRLRYRPMAWQAGLFASLLALAALAGAVVVARR